MAITHTHKLREKVEVETVTDAMHTRSKGVTAYHHTHHCLSKGLSSIPVFLNCCHSWHSLCMHVSYSNILTYMLVAPSPVHLHFYSLWSLTCAKKGKMLVIIQIFNYTAILESSQPSLNSLLNVRNAQLKAQKGWNYYCIAKPNVDRMN